MTPARLLSACFGAAGVLMVASLALILLPSRPRVVVAAAWFVALLPAVPHYSAFVYNDGLGFLASTATLVAGALALRRGPTRWRMTGLAAAAAAAALTRAPGLTLAGVAGLVAAAAGAGAAGLAGAARGRRRVALLAGWLLLAFLMVAWYDGNGGHTHARFLLPAIGVVAICAAVGHAGATPAPTPRAVADMLHRHGVAHPWMLLAAASLTVLVGFILQQGGLRLLASEQPRERPALPPAEVRPEPAAHP